MCNGRVGGMKEARRARTGCVGRTGELMKGSARGIAPLSVVVSEACCLPSCRVARSATLACVSLPVVRARRVAVLSYVGGL